MPSPPIGTVYNLDRDVGVTMSDALRFAGGHGYSNELLLSC